MAAARAQKERPVGQQRALVVVEAALARGEAPRVELLSSSANPRAATGAARVARLLQAARQAGLTLAIATTTSPDNVQALRGRDDMAEFRTRRRCWAQARVQLEAGGAGGAAVAFGPRKAGLARAEALSRVGGERH